MPKTQARALSAANEPADLGSSNTPKIATNDLVLSSAARGNRTGSLVPNGSFTSVSDWLDDKLRNPTRAHFRRRQDSLKITLSIFPVKTNRYWQVATAIENALSDSEFRIF